MEGGRETDPLHLFWLSGNSLKRTRNSRSKVFLQVTFRQTRGITAIPRHFLKQLLCTAVVAHAMVHGAKLELGVGYLAITGKIIQQPRKPLTGLLQIVLQQEDFAQPVIAVTRKVSLGVFLQIGGEGLNGFIDVSIPQKLVRRAISFGLSIAAHRWRRRSEEHTSELQSRGHLVCR